ncbi:MAG: ATP-binding protein [Blautia sp.]|nr:ATP-binding protein [Blautia sp.]
MALTNAQYDEIMRDYNERQLANRRVADSRRQSAYEKYPRLREIDDAVARCSVENAKLLLAGDAGALSALRDTLAALRAERQNLLAAGGYPADYLEPVYTCPDCKDTGYIDGQKCHCFQQAIINTIYVQSNIPAILEKENFASFSYEYYSDTDINPTTKLSSLATAKNAVEACHDFIDHFEEKPRNLLFYGDTGVGKTFLSNCVAREILDRGRSVIYFTSFQLFDILSKGVFEKDADAIAAHQNIFDCELLVIDDLGTELSNNFTVSQLFLCVNERILRGRSTIISTNLGLGQLTERYSERTFSRIMDNYVLIKLFTTDIRLQKRSNKRN